MTLTESTFTPDLETQIVLEDLYNKNQTLPRLRQEFRTPEILEHCKDHEIPADFAVDLLAQMVLHKRAKIATLVGILHKDFQADPDRIPTTAELQACADMVLKAAEVDLVDYDELSGQFKIRIDVSQDVYEELERYQYPLPLVVLPRELRSNRETGYHSEGSRWGSVILKAGNHHEDDICLDHINRVNRMSPQLRQRPPPDLQPDPLGDRSLGPAGLPRLSGDGEPGPGDQGRGHFEADPRGRLCPLLRAHAESVCREPEKEARSEQGVGAGVSRSHSPVRYGD